MNNDAPGGRFATFPVKARPVAVTQTPTFTLDLPLQTRHDLGPSFASSIADALEHKDDLDPFADSAKTPSILSPLPSASITPTVSTNPWADQTEETSRTHIRNSNLSDNDDALLAYLTSGDEEGKDSVARQPLQNQSFEAQALPAREEQIGGVSNPEPKWDKRISIEEEKRTSGSPSFDSPLVTVEHEDGEKI
jgi:hypothetical protein